MDLRKRRKHSVEKMPIGTIRVRLSKRADRRRSVTHAEWLTSTNPSAMLAAIPNASERKLKLWVESVSKISGRGPQYPHWSRTTHYERQVRLWSTEKHAKCTFEQKADLLREIFGNPLRIKPCVNHLQGWRGDFCKRCKGTEEVPDPIVVDPQRLTSNVVGLARSIYDENAWERMQILGDALMDAGCDDFDILQHCHSETTCNVCGGGKDRKQCDKCFEGSRPITHVRGCWLVDLLTGRRDDDHMEARKRSRKCRD